MKRFIIFLIICKAALTADGGVLLILTEPTARAYAGPAFDRWVNQIKREGNFSPVTVIELNRWSGNYSSNDWAGRTTDTTIADCIRTSTVRYDGYIGFFTPIAGDLSLPLATITQPPPRRATVNTLTIQ